MPRPAMPQATGPHLFLAHVQALWKQNVAVGMRAQAGRGSWRGPGALGSGGAGSGRQALARTEALNPYRCHCPIRLDFKKTYIQRYNYSNFQDCKHRALNPGSRALLRGLCLHWSHTHEIGPFFRKLPSYLRKIIFFSFLSL